MASTQTTNSGRDDGGTFGPWLRRELRSRDMRMADLARATGWPNPGSADPSNLSKWARGERTPDPHSCGLIASALGVPVDEVLVVAGHRPPVGVQPGSVRARLVAIIDQLPEELLEPLVPMLDGLRLDRERRARQAAAQRRAADDGHDGES